MDKKKKIIRRYFVCLGILLTLLAGLYYNHIRVKAKGMKPQADHLQDRFLKAEGKVLKNKSGKGDVVTLRGTNIGGWQVMEAWMCPTNSPDQRTTIATLTERFGKEKAEELLRIYEDNWWKEQDFDRIKELNFNVLRLPIAYFNLLGEDGKLRADTLATYDWFVKECEKRDIYVILDLHGAPGSQNGRDHSGDTTGSRLFSEDEAQKLTVSLWEQLAQHYKGNPTIAGYDLLNEPEGSESEKAPWGKVQLPFFDRLYKAIRAIDPDHVIIMNAVWEPTNMPDPSEYGWDNVMYEYHYYCWDGMDNPAKQRSFTDSKVANNTKAGFEVPVLIGEFTLFEKLSSWEYALSVYEEQGWSWTTWTYKTVGMGSWGIFNSTPATTPKVNIYTDTEEVIKAKWSKLSTTDSFVKNKYIYDLLQEIAGRGALLQAKGQADSSEGKKDTSRWFQSLENGDLNLRAGTDAEAAVVSSKETHAKREDSKVIQLTVSEAERMPTSTSRNVCIPPMIRNSVDASGLDYLLFDAYVRQGGQALLVTLVDKHGAVWSKFTAPEAMPMAYSWEKLFVDISDADIDTSAIIEIRIGANYPGTYYFDNLYFASSYGADLPTESKEDMEQSPGEAGNLTDWRDIPISSKVSAVVSMKWWIIPGIVLTLSLLGFITFRSLWNNRKKE